MKALDSHKKKFDVIIIGSGVGGLVCGSYLATAGLKILIVEQHDKPGGYCTSFSAGNYQFDVGVHYLGSMKRGVLRKIANEIDFVKYLQIDEFDPVEKIIMGKDEVLIRADFQQTIKGFKKCFPAETDNIDRFFRFIIQKDFYPNVYRKILGKTFKHILDEFFKDNRIKSLVGAISLWNIGANPSQTPALPAVALIREYMLDAGAYPRGGIQAFPNSLVEYIKSKGGAFVFSHKVKHILIRDNKITGVVLDSNKVIYSNIVVSNADAYSTFHNLLDIQSAEFLILKNLTISPSIFAAYIGLKKHLGNGRQRMPNILYYSKYSLSESMFNMPKIILTGNLPYLILAFSGDHDKSRDLGTQATLSLYIFANNQKYEFWEKNKKLILKLMIDKAAQLFPDLGTSIGTVISATPKSFYRITSNVGGAYLGWLPQYHLSRKHILRQRTSIQGLYCVGHWYTGEFLGCGGVPVASFSGRRAARFICEDLGLHWKYENISL